MEAKSFLNDYYLTPGRTGKFIPPQRHRARGGGGGGKVVMEPLPRVLICCLQCKAFVLLNKMGYIFWVVALLEACDVTNNVLHLGFYQELEIKLKPQEAVTSWCLTYEITHK